MKQEQSVFEFFVKCECGKEVCFKIEASYNRDKLEKVKSESYGV